MLRYLLELSHGPEWLLSKQAATLLVHIVRLIVTATVILAWSQSSRGRNLVAATFQYEFLLRCRPIVDSINTPADSEDATGKYGLSSSSHSHPDVCSVSFLKKKMSEPGPIVRINPYEFPY